MSKCDIKVRRTDQVRHSDLYIPGVGRAFLTKSKDEAAFRNVPDFRVHELRAMGYEVDVVKGDDPQAAAKPAAGSKSKSGGK